MESMEVSSFWESQDLQGLLFPSLSFGFNEEKRDGKGKIDLLLDELTNVSTSITDKEIKNEDLNLLDGDEDLIPEWMELKVDFSLLDGLDNLVDLLDDPNQVIEDEDSTEKFNLLKSEISTKIHTIEVPLELAASSVLASPPYSTPSSPEGLVPDVSPPNSPSSMRAFDNPLSFLTYQTQSESTLASLPSTSAFPVFDQGLNDCLFFLNQTAENGTFTGKFVEDVSTSSQLDNNIHIFVSEPADLVDLNKNEIPTVEIIESEEVDSSVSSPLPLKTTTKGRKRNSSEEIDDVPQAKQAAKCTSESCPSKPKARRERKRIQNKDAATRYRQKKRAEAGAVYDQESVLMDENKELTEKVNQLSTEISYLKGLMREMFKARGLLK